MPVCICMYLYVCVRVFMCARVCARGCWRGVVGAGEARLLLQTLPERATSEAAAAALDPPCGWPLLQCNIEGVYAHWAAGSDSRFLVFLLDLTIAQVVPSIGWAYDTLQCIIYYI